MSANKKAYQQKYHVKHYAENKQRYIDQAAARKAQLKAEVDGIKSAPCMDCGIAYPPYVMDFDHREDTVKEGIIARMVANNQRSAVFAEIAKCDVVCSNCHRERTQKRLHADVV